MRILFIHENQPCYLAESLFHGLRSVLGNDCVDVPRMDSMYSPLNSGIRQKLRGNGFTLYGLLNDSDELVSRRYAWRLELDKYDYIVLGHIWWQKHLLENISRWVSAKKIIILDGDDSDKIFPFKKNHFINNIKNLALISKIKYFKRELTSISSWLGFNESSSIKANLLPYKNIYPISYSIPEIKILKQKTIRIKNFPENIIDNELCTNQTKNNFFENEKDYYSDLQSSTFGITTKRAGWDCLRHYELAANGCVLCFKNLDKKNEMCAPQGLNKENCISYKSAEELIDKIKKITPERLIVLQNNTSKWIWKNTTRERAQYFLSTIINDN